MGNCPLREGGEARTEEKGVKEQILKISHKPSQ